MVEVIYRVDALDPWDGDTWEIGNFVDEKTAEYVKRKYEYTTNTGYSKAVITPIYIDDDNHYLLDKNDDNGYNRIGYFGTFNNDNELIVYRDKIAFEDRKFYSYGVEMDELIGKFDYFNNPVVKYKDEDIDLFYTEVPYYETDEQMEKEALDKFLKYKESL